MVGWLAQPYRVQGDIQGPQTITPDGRIRLYINPQVTIAAHCPSFRFGESSM